MTVVSVSESGIKRLFGISSDSKPSSNVPTGSLFYETDTGVSYVYDGSAWNTQSSRVSGGMSVVSVTPTITATAYNATTKNSVGGKQTLTGAVSSLTGIAILQSVLVTDKANQKAPLMILLFDSDPSAGTYTDNGQVNLSTDISKVIRRINVTAGDYETIDNSGTDYAVAEIGPISKLVKAASGTSLYAVIVTTGTPTYTSTSDLTVRFGFMQ